MKKLYFFLFLFSNVSFTFSQQLSSTFGGSIIKQDWYRTGYPGDSVPTYALLINILNFGADNTGLAANDIALTNAISSLNGENAVLYFPAGNYLFTSPVILRSGLILRGAGSDNTTLTFNLGAGSGDLIVVQGSAGASTAITNKVEQYHNQVTVADPAIAAPGNFIKIYQDNEAALINDPWADNTVGQIAYLKSKQSNTFTLYSRHRRAIDLSGVPRAQLYNMIKGVGIECLKIKRLDADPVANQTSNILFNYAAFCWVKGIESDSANFAHITMLNSSNIEITGSYFHGAFSYGSGGVGYGVVSQMSSGDCIIENNIFKHLRHAMLLQAGANGNTYAFNYSLQQKRTEFPSDAAGDIVLHGNYPYANLFEGNIAQYIIGDASHGLNGPLNVFFRNRALHYGISFSSGSGDSSIVIYNEITGTGNSTVFPYLSLGGFSTNGSRTIASKNYRLSTGAFTGNMESSFSPNQSPAITHFLEQTKPYFFNADLQPMGFPATYNSPFTSIPARDRFIAAGTLTVCSNQSRKDSMMPVNCNLQHISQNGGYDVHEIAETNEFRDNSNCGFIARILPSGSNPVSGVIKTKTTIDVTVQSYLGKAYVQRHYDIEPLTNAANATATLTLYFTQADFNLYNAANGSDPDLPSGPADLPGISNILITQFHGTGTVPGNYSGATEWIDPEDANIVWNAVTELWEISFNVTGFSGFYIAGASIVLPVKLVDFNYAISDRQNILLNWKVTSQQGIKNYIIERSVDGIAYKAIASVNANNENSFTYQYTDYGPAKGLYYYRIRITEVNGISYSKVLVIALTDEKNEITLFPVPATDQLTLLINDPALIQSKLQLFNIKGQLLQKININGRVQHISISHLNDGVYYLKSFNGKIYRIIKQ